MPGRAEGAQFPNRATT